MFGFLPHNLFTNHVGQLATNAGLSPRLWSNVTSSIMASDGSKRLVLTGDDFLGWGGGFLTSGAAKVGTFAGEAGTYVSFIESGGTIKQLTDEKGGVIDLQTDAGDNDDIMLTLGGNSDGATAAGGVLGAISDTAADAHLTAFECRFKLPVVSAAVNVFIGLAQQDRHVTNGLWTDAGVLADVDYIGFYVNNDDPDSLNFGYNLAGGTDNEKIADIKALTADTFVTAGILYDPDQPAASRIRVYIDNVENATKVSASDIATADFPDAQGLTFAAGIIDEGSVANSLEIDWWAFAQVI